MRASTSARSLPRRTASQADRESPPSRAHRHTQGAGYAEAAAPQGGRRTQPAAHVPVSPDTLTEHRAGDLMGTHGTFWWLRRWFRTPQGAAGPHSTCGSRPRRCACVCVGIHRPEHVRKYLAPRSAHSESLCVCVCVCVRVFAYACVHIFPCVCSSRCFAV